MFNFISIFDIIDIVNIVGESTTKDFEKSKIDKIIKENNITSFRIWFKEDWGGWDEGRLDSEILQKKMVLKGKYNLAGVTGSHWATPIILDTNTNIIYYI